MIVHTTFLVSLVLMLPAADSHSQYRAVVENFKSSPVVIKPLKDRRLRAGQTAVSQ